MSEKPKPTVEAKPGDGIRSLQTSRVFRIANFELYTKPVSSTVITYELNVIIMFVLECCNNGFRFNRLSRFYNLYNIYEA